MLVDELEAKIAELSKACAIALDVLQDIRYVIHEESQDYDNDRERVANTIEMLKDLLGDSFDQLLLS
jgi:uncharacterized coiled-coil protein SlyX